MQCIVKEVYSRLVVEVVWWDSPLMNIGDVVDILSKLSFLQGVVV